MNAGDIRFLSIGLLYIAIILFGFWLSHIGRPLNSMIFTVHKLLSVAAIILLVITIRQFGEIINFTGAEIGVFILIGIFLLGTFVSGGLLSFDKFSTRLILLLHQIFPALVVISTIIAFFLIRNHR